MKQLISGLIFLLILVSCSRNNMVVKGRITYWGNSMVYFEEVDIYQTTLLDSLMLRSSGKFKFSDNASYPKFYQLRFKDNRIISLLLEPGEKAEIKTDLNNIYRNLKVTGSEGTRLVNQINRELNYANNQLDSLSELFGSTDEPALKDSLIKKYDKVMENHRRFTITFLLNNSNSLAGYMALYQQYSEGVYVLNKVRDLQFYKIITDSLVKRYPRVKQVIALKQTTQKLLNNYNSQKLMSMSQKIEYGLPEIALPDAGDNIISLKSLKGKYVLLSFWTISNQQSNDFNLGLIDVYKKYNKKGFEIYNVSFDKSKTAWERSVKFNELNWINVIDTTFPYSKVAALYNIHTLPTNYFIDRDLSTIIAKDINIWQLDTKLAKLMN